MSSLNTKIPKKMVKNSFMLSLLTVSNTVISFVQMGYVFRIVGKDNNDILSAAFFITSFMQIFIDFGFVHSATGKIAKHRDNSERVNKIMTCVLCIKTLFIIISSAIMAIFIIPSLHSKEEILTYWLYLLYTILLALLPDYVYRGFERMTPITIRAVSIKLAAAALTFVFVKEKTDFYMVPLFNVIGCAGALITVYYHLIKKMNVHFCKVSRNDIWKEMKYSSQFFISRIASTVYGRANGLILTYVKSGVGDYRMADSIITVARDGFSGPIADSLYPNLMKNRDFSVVKRTLKLTIPIMLLGCTAVFFLAEPLLVLWLGEEGVEVVRPLRMLLPVAALSLPSYILGFSTLTPMGLTRYVNSSVTFATCIHIIMLAIAYFTNNLNIMTLCFLTCITESIILIYRVIAVYRNRHLMQKDAPAPTITKGTLFKIKRRVFWKLFSYLPKKQNKVVLQSYYGRGYSDNPRFIADEMLKRGGFSLYWVVKNEHEAATLPDGITPIQIDTIHSIYHLCTAGVWIDNSRKWAFTQKGKGQYYVQTWHAFALKRVESDAGDALPQDYITASKKDSAMSDLFVSNSAFLTDVYKTGFWYEGEILETGFPRNDILVNGDPAVAEKAREALGFPLEGNEDLHFLLYAPTFRKHMGLEVYDMDYEACTKAMSEKFGGRWIILARLHPNIAEKAADLNLDPRFVINASPYPDIQDLYLLADALISDYSSVMFDYMITEKPCFLYVNDLEYYRNDRNFYFDINKLPFALAENNKELIEIISTFDKKEYKEKLAASNSDFGIKESGRAAADTVDAILNRGIKK